MFSFRVLIGSLGHFRSLCLVSSDLGVMPAIYNLSINIMIYIYIIHK